jgi:uncharacterized protein YbjT (DUF2867 family)
MSGKTAAIIGATGMVGTYLAELLLQDDYFSTVWVIVRRPYLKTHPKIEVKLVDFNDAESLKLALEGTHAVFCCIGTTQKKVKGDKDLYRKIDFDIPVKTARFCKETDCEKFIIISAVGANSQSKTFYLRLKGEVEEALQTIGLKAVHIMQPAMLLGDRKEQRFVEQIIEVPMKLLSGLLSGSLTRYKSVHGKIVAAAMLNAAKKEEAGFFKYTYDGIVELSRLQPGV